MTLFRSLLQVRFVNVTICVTDMSRSLSYISLTWASKLGSTMQYLSIQRIEGLRDH